MARPTISLKRLQIDKSNANTIAVLAASSAIVVFSLTATRALISQRGYQSRVIAQKKNTLAQLKTNNQAAAQLVESYKNFQEQPTNIIGGSSSGSGDRDGDNSKIVLDALPSKYDFPALVASIDKILSSNGYKADSITGTDDEINQTSSDANGTEPVEIPFEVSVSGSFDVVQGVIDVFQRSIRPINIAKLQLSGGNGTIRTTIDANTYYQPEKTVNITTKVVK